MKPITLESLKEYVRIGRPTGGFLEAVLENNLFRAVANADAENRRDIVEICQYVYNDMPASCWGSPEKVDRWIAAGGMTQYEAKGGRGETENRVDG